MKQLSNHDLMQRLTVADPYPADEHVAQFDVSALRSRHHNERVGERVAQAIVARPPRVSSRVAMIGLCVALLVGTGAGVGVMTNRGRPSVSTNPVPNATSAPDPRYPQVDPVIGSAKSRLAGTNTLFIGTSGVADARQADTISLLRCSIESQTPARCALSFSLALPRDTYVHIPQSTTSGRLANAYRLGGTPLLADTIRENLGISIQRVVEFDVDGFGPVADALGGISLCFDAPIRDRVTGLKQSAGCNKLDARQTIAYAQSRNFETKRDGTWMSDQSGDTGRSQRHITILRQSFLATFTSNPKTLTAATKKVLASAITITPNDEAALKTLGQTLSSDDVAAGTRALFVDLPVVPATVNGETVLMINQKESASVVAIFQ